MEHKNDHINLDTLFQNARDEAPEVSFEDTKAEFLNSVAGVNMPSSSSGISGFFSSKIFLLMTTSIITIVSISAMFLLTDSSSTKNESAVLPVQEKITQELVIIPQTVVVSETMEKPITTASTVVLETQEPAIEPLYKLDELLEPVEIDISTLKMEPKRQILSIVTDSVYHFPSFTEEEKKTYAKLKSKMIKELIKRDKKTYSFIPNGVWDLPDDTIVVRPFHMQNTEVTNLQYRTFLVDLLVQNKRDMYLKAKPDQDNWLGSYPKYNGSMAELYFTHPAYNGYPVNNISREGAELYCKWLTNSANEVLQSKNKPLINDVRLPTREEWIHAASGGDFKNLYPWGGSYTRNTKGCYLANFNPDSVPADQDGMMLTAPVYSYAPNDYGLYCMSGNVAEMVYYNDAANTPGALGGSFNSPSNEIQINGSDKFKGITTSNVNIGFRVVISYGLVGAMGRK